MTDNKYASNLIGAFATMVSTKVETQILDLGGRSLNHEAALVAIHNHPNETIDVLSKVLGLTHSGVVRLINMLEKEDFVVRHKSTKDARAVVLQITDKGTYRVKEILLSREKVTSKVLASFDDAQKQALVELLETAMGDLAGEQMNARRICRLCNEGVCRKRGCPVEMNITTR